MSRAQQIWIKKLTTSCEEAQSNERDRIRSSASGAFKAALYAQEYGWDDTYEALVAQIVADFVKNYDRKKERCWIAERDGENIGCVFLVKESKQVARLRLLIVPSQGARFGSRKTIG